MVNLWRGPGAARRAYPGIKSGETRSGIVALLVLHENPDAMALAADLYLDRTATIVGADAVGAGAAVGQAQAATLLARAASAGATTTASAMPATVVARTAAGNGLAVTWADAATLVAAVAQALGGATAQAQAAQILGRLGTAQGQAVAAAQSALVLVRSASGASAASASGQAATVQARQGTGSGQALGAGAAGLILGREALAAGAALGLAAAGSVLARAATGTGQAIGAADVIILTLPTLALLGAYAPEDLVGLIDVTLLDGAVDWPLADGQLWPLLDGGYEPTPTWGHLGDDDMVPLQKASFLTTEAVEFLLKVKIGAAAPVSTLVGATIELRARRRDTVQVVTGLGEVLSADQVVCRFDLGQIATAGIWDILTYATPPGQRKRLIGRTEATIDQGF